MRGFVFFAVASLAAAGPFRAQSSSGPAGSPQSEITSLEPGKPIERTLQGGEKHIYAIRAETGHLIHAIVDQLGIDVVLTLYAPDDKQIGSMDSPNGNFGLEQISTIAEAPGIYRLEVASGDKNVPAGRYRVTVEPVRAPSGQDRARITAERMLFEAEQLRAQGSADSFKMAIQKYQATLPLWRTAGDRYEEALTQDTIGFLSSALGEKQKALDYYNQALPLRRAVGDRAGEARTLSSLGAVYSALGEKQKALDYYNQTLPLRRAVGDRAGEASTLNNIGLVYDDLGEKQKALDYFNQALPLQRAVGDRAGEATTLSNIGLVYDALGKKQKALDYYNQALPLMRAVGDRAGEATTLSNIGVVYDDLGEKQKALDYYSQALPLWRAVGDRAGEAVTLNNIGRVYNALGEKQKALDNYNQALPLRRAVGDRAGEATTLSNIGVVYDDLGEEQKALDYYNQALPLRRAVGDRAGEATTLNNIGGVYDALGEKQKALNYYSQVLPLMRAVGDRAGEAGTLNNIGLVYDDLGEKQKALDYYNQSLPLQRAVGDRAGEATTLSNIGSVYHALGEKQKALDYFNQALPLQRAVGDRAGEATTLSNIGSVYNDLGEKQKALDYYNQALPLRRAVGDRAGEASTLSNIGLVYHALGEKQKALDYYNQALPLRRAVGDRAGEATTLSNIGSVYDDLGEKQKALDYYTQSLPLSRAVQDPLGEASTLVLMMEYWKSLQNPSLAVLFGKQAIDRFQQVRRNIGGLEKEARQSFLKSKEDRYRELAELLISGGRLPEAQQVLDMLKAEEYSEFTQRRGDAGSGTNPVARTAAEEKSNQEYERITGEITAIGEEWTQLHAKSSRSADEEKRYNELSDRLTAANQRFQVFLKTLYDSFGKGDPANAKVETINERTAGLQTLVGELGGGTAAVYTLVLEEKCVVMVITPATRVAREIPIGKIALRGKVFAFARALASHQSEEDILPKAQDLYNVLIAPIEKDLQGAQAKTLVWSLDDVLRYVPLAALHDGKQYLVERYRNVVITTASVGNLKDQPQVGNWRGAAMGVSKDYDGLGKLKAVPDELDSVVHSDKTPGSHGPVPGTILLDDSFTEAGMETALDQHPPLVHIASHYVFHVGDDTKSYLLLGGKNTGGQGFHLTLADLRDDQRMDFKGIELLTLSGCETAVGSNDSDGREIDGLGITAQRKGAKAVMATLWKVDDASVGLLMATFYKLWVTTPGITKAEALQRAQLALLRGPMDSLVGASRQRPVSQYANPFYWAPFILIGNWK
jgi:CHAT domain-containing protein/tetratricopeptide (TPR) repeat protein